MAVGIAAFTALVGFSRSFEQAWLRLYEGSGTDLVVVQKMFLNTSVDEAVGAKLRAIPDVAAAEPFLANLVDLTPEINALVYGWPADSFEFTPLNILQGRRFRDGVLEVMLGEVLADNLGKKAGDSLEIQGATFQVVGVFRGGSALEIGAAIMPIDQLQRLTDLTGKVTAFHVRLRKPANGESGEALIRQARATIEAAVPGLKAVPAGDRARNNQLVSLGWKRVRVMKLILIEAAALDEVLTRLRAARNTADFTAAARLVDVAGSGERQSHAITVKAHAFPDGLRSEPGSSLLIINRGSAAPHHTRAAFDPALLTRP